ncbi:class I SAM-dependent DNA methyltransferase [Actinocrispum wychmicini]|uniref:Ubiquinone/menaquinone biosynthesis C-methylase UbiE n=1 Tax=Actinocrispum wychmicini TaxID=1213861 RepID=A0A4R2INF5_9PSEU|nr:class I SAM-dependent methyltransferase [Actinocrispum wychmicini]TCO46624.1 ubiquinone/menaquinone biosynthesis C-methylase UbiE [Actinocrispum wychmicini]
MQTEIFGSLHARWYDRWHARKDYQSEVDQLDEVFSQYGPVASVLDLGCGTARHLALLATLGYAVTGVDRSPAMVALARDRIPSVVQADLMDVRLNREFDAVIMMFSVLGYLGTTGELLGALGTARRHLRPGGLLVVDILDGSAVLSNGPMGGFTAMTDGPQTLLRATTGRVHTEEQIYEMGVKLWLISGDRLVEEDAETHSLRFFLPRELDLILELAGFEMIDSAPVGGGQPGPAREWSRLVWARRT